MTIARLHPGFLAGFFTIIMGLAPALAASPVTTAFLANLQANVAFLDQSSRIAADHAGSETVRAFASGESTEQGKLASDLNSLMPLIASSEGTVVTGRSVAIDGEPGQGVDQAAAANGRAPLVGSDLDRLTALSGRAFDDLYWQTQLDALSQIEADYRAYIAHGDDPVLVAMAKVELPKIMHRLELLTKI